MPGLNSPPAPDDPIRSIDLGRMAYAPAAACQGEHLARVVDSRGSAAPVPGVILLVEHDPVITVTRRAGSAGHVLASPDTLAQAGVEVATTDRGGDVTYHGPGQLVVYPIIDLNAHGLRIVEYVRLLESAIMGALATMGLDTTTDPGATGVWVRRDPLPMAKVGAIGVRVRQWVSMHGLSINLDPDMSHFDLIVPCGLAGRPVTSVRAEAARLGLACPTMPELKSAMVTGLRARLRPLREGRAPPGAGCSGG